MMSMQSEGKELLARRLDESLREHGKALGGGDGLPEIAAVYELQELAEVHCYLKTEHPFTPNEVSALLRFADPLEVAAACWEENPDRYAFDICRILEENQMRDRYPAAEPEPERRENPSVREKLREAVLESRRQTRTEPASGHDARGVSR